MSFKIIQGDCEAELNREKLQEIDFFKEINLIFLDPLFNQNKYYAKHDDNLSSDEYWNWMKEIIEKVYELTSSGGAIYFMQREKNSEHVLRCLRETGWEFQNFIIWKKKTSAVPSTIRFGKQYQIIAFATKGRKPRVFHRLRIDPPLLLSYKHKRENGIYVTDIWDDIRELTSGYFAGDEPLRKDDGSRFHKQQSPVQLLTRILLSSTNPGDLVLDPFAGTGTTPVVAEQLCRNSISIELDSRNVRAIKERLAQFRECDDISSSYSDYKYTKDLALIWPNPGEVEVSLECAKDLEKPSNLYPQMKLFDNGELIRRTGNERRERCCAYSQFRH